VRGNKEHLDDGGIGLIDMNGRVYDPLLGRFTSADPYIQDAQNLQSLNRYSYVQNNPTSSIDPSGYFSLGGLLSGIGNAISSVGKAIVNAASAVGTFVGNNAETIGIVAAIVVVSVVTYGAADELILGALSDAAAASTLGGLGAAVVAGAAAGAVAGGLSSALLGGGFSWQAVGMGALTGAVSGGIGSFAAGAGPVGRIGLAALSGGVTSWLTNAAQGHAGIHSFFQGVELGAIIGAAQVGVNYLLSGSEQQAATSGVNRVPAGLEDDPYYEPSDIVNAEMLQGPEDAAIQGPLTVQALAGGLEGAIILSPGAADYCLTDPYTCEEFGMGFIQGIAQSFGQPSFPNETPAGVGGYYTGNYYGNLMQGAQ
jgi:RHS repeat-associated protein